MNTSFFKQTIIISLFSHITILGVFSFSFGGKLPLAGTNVVSFWGGILKSYDFKPADNLKNHSLADTFFRIPELPKAKEIDKLNLSSADYSIKPAVANLFAEGKEPLPVNLNTQEIFFKRKESVVMFYPALPYHFSLYFKDRQVAHIELEYSVIPRGKTGVITVRRKVSSGNLEADLLCMRYIEQYLSGQQERLASDKWQAVKIELETKK